MCGKDRATGVGAKYMDDVVEVMIEEGEKWWILLLLHNNMLTFVINKLCKIFFCQRKKSKKDPLWNSFLIWDFECCLKKKKSCILGTLSF